MATRAIMIKADGSVLLHSDGGSYKPLNWMSPPCTMRVLADVEDADGVVLVQRRSLSLQVEAFGGLGVYRRGVLGTGGMMLSLSID